MIKVLVLLSTFNGENFLKQQLDSLKQQESVDIYCLVRDDGSNDTTTKIIEQYSKEWTKLEYSLESNIGCSSSYISLMEKAIHYNDFDYFAFCDQDDYWLPDKLENAIKTFEENQTPQLYCSNLTLVDENLNIIKKMYEKPIRSFSKPSLLVEQIGTGCTMVFNRQALNFFLNNKPTIPILHDRWFVLIMMFTDKKIYFDNNSYIFYRQHSKNVVGYNYTLKSRLISKYHSFFKLNETPRRNQANELIKICSSQISKQDIELIKIVANFNMNLKTKFRFFFARNKGLKMSTLKLDFWFRLRILFGSV